MRYRDAPHVDTRAFLARRPDLGPAYTWLGLLGIVAAWWAPAQGAVAVWLCAGACAALWALAWWQAVGPLWRTALLAGLLLASLQLHALACGCCDHLTPGAHP